MKSIWPDFSQVADLALEARVVADVQSVADTLGVPVLLAGAFARDLHLMHGLGVDVGRRTEDIDFALSVRDWQAFADLREQLLKGGRFNSQRSAEHRLLHQSGLPVDILPFGAVETEDRLVRWPPNGAVQMDVFGFSEALGSAPIVRLPAAIEVRVVTLPALALLKLVAWNERHYTTPRKDALDLMLVLQHYLGAVGDERLWTQFLHWTEEEEFDYERAGARMLGYDLGAMLDAVGRVQVTALVAAHISVELPTRLPAEMSTHQPRRALALLQALHKGLQEVAV